MSEDAVKLAEACLADETLTDARRERIEGELKTATSQVEAWDERVGALYAAVRECAETVEKIKGTVSEIHNALIWGANQQQKRASQNCRRRSSRSLQKSKLQRWTRSFAAPSPIPMPAGSSQRNAQKSRAPIPTRSPTLQDQTLVKMHRRSSISTRTLCQNGNRLPVEEMS